MQGFSRKFQERSQEDIYHEVLCNEKRTIYETYIYIIYNIYIYNRKNITLAYQV